MPILRMVYSCSLNWNHFSQKYTFLYVYIALDNPRHVGIYTLFIWYLLQCVEIQGILGQLYLSNRPLYCPTLIRAHY
jgi:hypothetical protein